MKRRIVTALATLALMLMNGSAMAAAPLFGQVTCTTEATQIYSGGNFISIILQNHTPTTAVYIGPRSTLTASNGGILLSTTTGTGIAIDKGAEPWYCITASGEATVGYTVRR
ncbi:MAG: hypothetical protein ABFD91_04075 [Anaerohalosphaeraceae bacterium]